MSLQEIAIMAEGGRRLKRVLERVLGAVRVGTTPLVLDTLAEKLIVQEGGQPSFKMIQDYRWATCICVNDCVVHGVPTNELFLDGDVVGVDCGMLYKGFNTDTAWTREVQSAESNTRSFENKKFLKVGEMALGQAILACKVGNHIGHISKAIQRTVEREGGYSVVHELVGHGVGKKLHEDPEVPGFLGKKIEKTPLITEGMVLAIEIIYNRGKRNIYIDERDGWTIRTKDGTISGLFEKTVALTSKGAVVLT